MFYMKYNRITRQLSYANAGHNRPLLLPAGETACRELDAEGLVLGVYEQVAFEEKRIVLRPGDRVLLYTDGITEAQNPQGEFFGEGRLSRLFAAQGSGTPQQVIQRIVAELRAFCASHSFADDVSLVALNIS
jgi:serine phosphatase RsbU (regulator of sigma subunit)